MTARPHLHLIIGILVGAVFIYLAFRSVDIGQMLGALADANYWYVLLAVLVNMFSHYLRALRWQYFLAPVKIVNSGTLFSALIIGYAANTFVPAHLGEFLRAFVLGKKQSISASSSFASIVIERIVDVFSLILLMVLVVFIHPFPRWVVQSGYIMLAAAVVAFIMLIGFKRFEAKSTLMIQFLLKPLPEKIGHKLGSMIFNFLTGV
ncbi:MAG: lysylphosphatidylglycerol synthase transmembrane domain-containing protein, partial [Desulfobacteraceae bacterium]